MATKQTRSQVAIEERLKELDPTTDRYHVLSAALDFKTSWVELGERLSVIAGAAEFKKWGFPSFELYCRRELHIKNDTAAKLTRSFQFLKENEPTALEARNQRELPPLDVVDMLSQARDKTSLSQAQVDSIRGEVFDAEAVVPPNKNQVVKRFREVDPDAFRPKPKDKKDDPAADLRKALLLAERLQAVLETVPGISSKTLANVRGAAAELKKAAEKARGDDA